MIQTWADHDIRVAQIVRMTGEEMSFRPVALAGPLNQVTNI